MPLLLLALGLAHGHPTVDDHLHATDELGPCDDTARMRRVAALADAERYDDAMAELRSLCHPEVEQAVLAEGRLRLLSGDPAGAEALLAHRTDLDAAVVRADALVLLDRSAEAGALVAAALAKTPSAVPDHYLDAAARCADPHTARTVLLEGVGQLGEVGVLVRALARREAELGELSSGLSRLKTERLADEILRGDLLAEAGRSHEARLAWEHALQMTETARQTPAMLQARADLSARLQSP